MAPELCTKDALSGRTKVKVSQAVDVYAYGVMMYEAIELDEPWKGKEYSFNHKVFKAVLRGERPKFSDIKKQNEAPPGFMNLLQLCWSQDPDARPPFDVVLSTLQDIQANWHFHSGSQSKVRKVVSNKNTSSSGRKNILTTSTDLDDGIELSNTAV